VTFHPPHSQSVDVQAELTSELERRVGLNGSKLPSSDGLGKPPAPKRGNVKGQKPCGQKGRKEKTLYRSGGPDHVKHHFPSSRTHYRHALVVVDHVVHKCICQRCSGETMAWT